MRSEPSVLIFILIITQFGDKSPEQVGGSLLILFLISAYAGMTKSSQESNNNGDIS